MMTGEQGGQRTTKCGKTVKKIDATGWYIYVSCKACIKAMKPTDRKEPIRDEDIDWD